MNPVQRTDSAVKESRSWIVTLGRFGYLASGIVYLLVGAQAAGAITGIKGSLERLTGSTSGMVALGLLVIGLAGYAVWSFVQASVGFMARGIVGLVIGFFFLVAAIEIDPRKRRPCPTP